MPFRQLNRNTSFVRCVLALFALSGCFAGVHCTAEQITVGERFTITSKLLGEDRTIFVSLPASYSHSSQRFPVLYLTDAQWQFDQTRSSAALLARNGLIPQLIIVGITNQDRTRDLYATQADFKSGDRVVSFPTSGHADAFLEFIEKELIPWTESHYRAASLRILAGHSAGGYFAVHTMRAKPGLFQAIIAASPWVAWDDFKELKQISPLLETSDLHTRVLFLSSADEGTEMREGIQGLTAALRARKDRTLRWEVASYPTETHDSTTIKSYYDALRMLFREWDYPRDPKTNLPVGSLEDIKAHFARFGEHLGYVQLPPEYVVNEVGYRYLHDKAIDQAVAAFKYNTEINQFASNAWDSLADALEQGGDKSEAIASERKAVSLAEQNADSNLSSLRKHLARLEAPGEAPK